ncbi:hypothetical protein BJF79_47690 [Actinomadura sp. CNU-125]|uniref:hypothetical protein n=1 Tax=Actinomadura sp. CNU-125 TaxID=1904961 RepID=UPI00095FBBD1|nr:hypothetical protein [Actinomadura sp. CNU-125]OLT19604.1 hypothetical protein BJF79_47690 [Actinomadura sp. CNU-125]
MGLGLVRTPPRGSLVHALRAAAPGDFQRIGGGEPSAGVEHFRDWLGNELSEDARRDPAERRYWPLLERHFAEPADGGVWTDDERGRLVTDIRNGRGPADEATLAAGAVVLGRPFVVVRPDGSLSEFGPAGGGPAVLVELSKAGAGAGRWGSTEPASGAAASAPSTPRTPQGVRLPRPKPSVKPAPQPARPPQANLGVDPFAGRAGNAEQAERQIEPPGIHP